MKKVFILLCFFSTASLLLTLLPTVKSWTAIDDPVRVGTISGYTQKTDFLCADAMLINNAEELVVSDRYTGKIEILTLEGVPLRSFPTERGDYLLNPAHLLFQRQIQQSSAGNYYLADTNHKRVVVFNENLEYQFHIGSDGVSGTIFSQPQGIAVTDERLFVSDSTLNKIFIFTLSGEYIGEFGSAGNADGQFNTPIGLTTSADNTKLYVTDSYNYRIQVFDTTGTFLSKFGTSGSGAGQLNRPYSISRGPGNKLFVADYSNHRFAVFTEAGAFVINVGSFGTGDGQFRYPMGTAVSADGKIYVSDCLNLRIQIYNADYSLNKALGADKYASGNFFLPIRSTIIDNKLYVSHLDKNTIDVFNPTSGELLFSFGSSGTGPGQFSRPNGMATDATGNIYICESSNARTQVFNANLEYQYQITLPSGAYDCDIHNDRIYLALTNNTIQIRELNGTLISSFGGAGTGNGQFNLPYTLIIDKQERIVIADENNNRIQVFSLTGDFLFKFGTSGSGDGQLNKPYSISVSQNNTYFVADTMNNRISVFDASGNFLNVFSSVYEIYSPGDIFIDENDTIFITSRNLQQIYKYQYDKQAPTGSLLINGGAAKTNSPTVTLTVTATDTLSSITNMMISENSDFTGASWTSYQLNPSFTLSNPDGLKTVYVKFEDSFTNISETYSANIYLDTTVPNILLTKLGQISNIPDKASLTYYFTSQTPTILGITEENSTVTFTANGQTYTTIADTNGDFSLSLTTPKLLRGENIISYKATDSAGNLSETRSLKLIIGEEYFPEWLYALVVSGGQTIDTVDQNSKQEDIKEETDNTKSPEVKTFKILIKNSNGVPIANTQIQIKDKYYTTDTDGYVFIAGLETATLSYEINDIKGEFLFNTANDITEITVTAPSEEQPANPKNTTSISWLLLTIPVILIVAFVLRYKKRA